MNDLEVLEIPEIPEPIKEASRNGCLVVFVGAGVSKIVGCPTWEEFAHVYLDHIKNNGNYSA